MEAGGPGRAAAAPRRHRQRQDGGVPARGGQRRSSAAARRSCSCPRSRSRRRRPAASSSASGTPWRWCTRAWRRASATTSGGACAAARRACAWARARPSSRPFDDLGLIVIDEEHDSSYKQEGDPRYDARVVAERRASEEGAVLLAGSATPRPESIVRYDRLRLGTQGRPAPAAAGGARGHARRAGSAPRAHAHGARRRAPPRREGDRAAEPARLVELPLVPRLRAGLGVPRLRRDARAPPRRRRDGLPPLRPPRARSAGLPRLRLGLGGAPRRGHRAARARAGGAGAPAARLPARRRRDGGRRQRRRAAPRSTPRPPGCWWAPRWWPRATTSRRSRWRWCSTPTPRCAFPTSAPRSAPSPWWRSSPAAAGAGSAAAR